MIYFVVHYKSLYKNHAYLFRNKQKQNKMELDIFLSVSVPEFRASLACNGKLKAVCKDSLQAPIFFQREWIEKEVRKSQEKSSKTAAQHSGKGAQHRYVLYLELSCPWTSSKYYIFKIVERLLIKIHSTRFKIILN